MALSETRKGELALLYLKLKLRDEGIRLVPEIRRQIGNTAKAVGISYAEAFEFAEGIVRELMEETFAGGPGKNPAEQTKH